MSVSHGLQATLKGWHMHTGDSLTCFNSAVNSQPSSSRGPRMPRKLGTVELCRAVAMPTPTSLTEVYNAASLACDTTPRSAHPQQRHASNLWTDVGRAGNNSICQICQPAGSGFGHIPKETVHHLLPLSSGSDCLEESRGCVPLRLPTFSDGPSKPRRPTIPIIP